MGNKKPLAPEVKAALDDINGLVPSRKRENLSKTGKASAIEVVRPVKPKRVTAKTKALFNDLARDREKAFAQMKTAQETKKRAEDRMHKLVLTYGRNQINEGKEKDLILYANPFKGELAWNISGGAIDTEKVAEKYPELISPAVETLNLTQLDELIKSYDVPESTKALVQKFRSIVAQLQKATETPLINMQDDRLLDIEAYRAYKESGKITPSQVEKFESHEGHYSLKIHKLTDASRCSGCGHKRPKRLVNSKAHTCTRCGQTE